MLCLRAIQINEKKVNNLSKPLHFTRKKLHSFSASSRASATTRLFSQELISLQVRVLTNWIVVWLIMYNLMLDAVKPKIFVFPCFQLSPEGALHRMKKQLRVSYLILRKSNRLRSNCLTHRQQFLCESPTYIWSEHITRLDLYFFSLSWKRLMLAPTMIPSLLNLFFLASSFECWQWVGTSKITASNSTLYFVMQ